MWRSSFHKRFALALIDSLGWKDLLIHEKLKFLGVFAGLVSEAKVHAYTVRILARN